MHRIDGPGATVDHKFTEGDPIGGVAATVVTAAWMNDVQEELMTLLTTAGISPVKGTQNQVMAALMALSTGVGGATSNDYIKIPFRDKTTGVRRELVLQWMDTNVSTTGGTVTFPLQFPNACFVAIGVDKTGSAASTRTIGVGTPTTTGVAIVGLDAAGTSSPPGDMFLVAIGW